LAESCLGCVASTSFCRTFESWLALEELLLVVHILSAAIWIGTAVFFGYAGPRFRNVGGPAVAGWIEVALGAIPRFISPVAILTMVSGVALVVVQDEWGWDDGFVWVGLAVFVLVLAVGVGWNAPNMRKGLAAFEAGDLPAVAKAMREVANGGLLMVSLLVLAEFAMVYRFAA
jgi:hypothetical protein